MVIVGTIASAQNSAAAGGAPGWVLPNAKYDIDLVNNLAWSEADGLVAVDTLLGSDANTVNSWYASAYNEADLTPAGLVYAAHAGPALIGGARTLAIAGSTILLRFVSPSAPDFDYLVLAADGNNSIDLSIGGDGSVSASSYNGSWVGRVPAATLVSGTPTSYNAIAATLTPSRGEVAANGSDPFVGVIDSTDWPTAGGFPMVAAMIDIKTLRRVTLFAPIVGSAGLTALSVATA